MVLCHHVAVRPERPTYFLLGVLYEVRDWFTSHPLTDPDPDRDPDDPNFDSFAMFFLLCLSIMTPPPPSR